MKVISIKIYKSNSSSRAMKREDIAIIAQILTSMKTAAEKLEKAIKQDDKDSVNIAKKEILSLQEQFAKII